MQADNNMQYCQEVMSCTCEGRLCQTVQAEQEKRSNAL